VLVGAVELCCHERVHIVQDLVNVVPLALLGHVFEASTHRFENVEAINFTTVGHIVDSDSGMYNNTKDLRPFSVLPQQFVVTAPMTTFLEGIFHTGIHQVNINT